MNPYNAAREGYICCECNEFVLVSYEMYVGRDGKCVRCSGRGVIEARNRYEFKMLLMVEMM